VWDKNFCRAGRWESNGDEWRWRWRTEREIISRSFVGERESRDSGRERAGQEATKERREESFLSLK
jgi:hypothetical protein